MVGGRRRELRLQDATTRRRGVGRRGEEGGGGGEGEGTRWPQRERLALARSWIHRAHPSAAPVSLTLLQTSPRLRLPQAPLQPPCIKSGLVLAQIWRARWALCQALLPPANQGAARDRATDRSSSTARFRNPRRRHPSTCPSTTRPPPSPRRAGGSSCPPPSLDAVRMTPWRRPPATISPSYRGSHGMQAK